MLAAVAAVPTSPDTNKVEAALAKLEKQVEKLTTDRSSSEWREGLRSSGRDGGLQQIGDPRGHVVGHQLRAARLFMLVEQFAIGGLDLENAIGFDRFAPRRHRGKGPRRAARRRRVGTRRGSAAYVHCAGQTGFSQDLWQGLVQACCGRRPSP